MAFLSIVLAAAAAFALGGLWFGVFARPWQAAAGVTQAQIAAAGRSPFIVAAVAAVVSAGALRHVLSMSGVSGAGAGFVAGLGVGLFICAPWIAMNYAFALRPRALWLIDGGYVAAALAIMGAILGAFA